MVYFEREAKVSFVGFFGAELIMLCVISDVMVGRLVIRLSHFLLWGRASLVYILCRRV